MKSVAMPEAPIERSARSGTEVERRRLTGLQAMRSCSTERLLLDELTHRVNNELTAAIAIASVEIARAKSEEIRMSLARIRRSLDGFARVHRVLRVPDLRARVDACEQLRALCGAIHVARLEPLGIELQFNGTPLRLDSEQCWRLAIIVCELVTNASRHAFVKCSGRITVETWGSDAAVHCRVSDDGQGAQRSTAGMGLRIVEALLRDLNGRLEMQTSAAGSIFTLAFPRSPA